MYEGQLKELRDLLYTFRREYENEEFKSKVGAVIEEVEQILA